MEHQAITGILVDPDTRTMVEVSVPTVPLVSGGVNEIEMDDIAKLLGSESIEVRDIPHAEHPMKSYCLGSGKILVVGFDAATHCYKNAVALDQWKEVVWPTDSGVVDIGNGDTNPR